MSHKKKLRTPKLLWILISALALCVFCWRSGAIRLFDLDEALYVSCARQMILTGDYITPRLNSVPPGDPTALTTPFFEKPILVYWASAGAMRLFGLSEGAARIPVALTSLATLALIVVFATRFYGKRAGLLAGLCFLTSPLTVVDARQMTTDGLLILWISGMLFLYASLAGIGGRPRRKTLVLILFWLCGAAAVLTKGIVGLLLPALIIFFYNFSKARSTGEHETRKRGIVTLTRKGLSGFHSLRPLLGLLCVILLTAPWHLAISSRHERDSQGRDFVQEYVIRQHIGRFKGGDKVHNAPIISYFGYLLIGFFPWACFLPSALRKPKPHSESEPELQEEDAEGSAPAAEVRRYLTVWIGVIFVFFSLASAKLPTYIAPLYPAASVLVGAWLARAIATKKLDRNLIRGAQGATLTSALLVFAVLIAPRFLPKNAPVSPAVLTLAVHLTVILLVGSIIGWICFAKKWRLEGIGAMAGAMVLLVAFIAGEGYTTAQRDILAPYQEIAISANTLHAPGETVIYYNIVPRRPSMLFYADYSPVEQKDPPLTPLLATLLTPQNRTVLVALSRDSYRKRLEIELKTSPQIFVTVLKETDGWLLLRLKK